jgi:hypothetical protein
MILTTIEDIQETASEDWLPCTIYIKRVDGRINKNRYRKVDFKIHYDFISDMYLIVWKHSSEDLTRSQLENHIILKDYIK